LALPEPGRSHPSNGDESDNDDDSEYVFSNPEGYKLARKILQPQLPYDLHDAQIEGICKAIDGVDIMVLTPRAQENWVPHYVYAPCPTIGCRFRACQASEEESLSKSECISNKWSGGRNGSQKFVMILLCPFRSRMTVMGAVQACHGYTSDILFDFKAIITIEACKWRENYNSDSD
jgi:hypothetical protein